MVTNTPRLGLDDYAIGDTDWDHSDLVQYVEEHAVERDTFANRPASGEYDGEPFLAEDRLILYRWDAGSTSWEAVAGMGTSANPLPGTVYREAVHTEDVTNVHFLPSYSGSTLDAKWDTLRSNFTAGAQKVVIVPPPEGGETAAREAATDVWDWKVESPLTIDDPENNLHLILGRTSFVPTAAITSFIEISPTNKSENITISGGRFLQLNGNATHAIQGHGGSRITITDINTGNRDTTTFTKGIDWPGDTSSTSELRVSRWNVAFATDRSVHLHPNSGQAVSNSTIREGVGGGSQVVDIQGPGNHITVEEIFGRGDAEAVSSAVVRVREASAGRPQNLDIDDISTTENVTAVETTDATGSGSQLRGVSIGGYLKAGSTGSLFSLDHLREPTVNIPRAGGSTDAGTVGSGTIDAIMDLPVTVEANLTDNGTRTIVNGVHEAAIANGSVPSTSNYPDGTIVKDTDRSAGSWLIKGGEVVQLEPIFASNDGTNLANQTPDSDFPELGQAFDDGTNTSSGNQSLAYWDSSIGSNGGWVIQEDGSTVSV